MDQNSNRVTAIGAQAHHVLKSHHVASVAGTSRRGLYLQPVWAPTLFVSRDPFRGPLTINIRIEPEAFYTIQTGERANLSTDELYFPDLGLGIEIKSPLVWKPSPPPERKSLTNRQIQEIIDQAQTLQPDNPYLPLLDMSVSGSSDSTQEFAGIEKHIQPIVETLAGGDSPKIFFELRNILGAGPGLTPLADDFTLGILLAIHRTRIHLSWFKYEEYSPILLGGAGEKSTMVSYSLLKCALKGAADERLIRVLDGLIAGRKIPDEDLNNLLSWGSSSGVGVLAGMLLVLSRLESAPSPFHGSGTSPGLSGR
jgi:hypothetical protein